MRLPVLVSDGVIAREVPPASGIDCVVVGHNDPCFHDMIARARSTENVSAFYQDAKVNSVLLGGRRLHYMELLNKVLAEASGRPLQLSSFEQPSLAVCYLTSFLRRRGLNCEFINFFSFERERLRELLGQAPRAVALTTTYYVEADPLVEVIQFIRKHSPDTKIILGGPYVYRLCSSHDETTQEYFFQGLGADFYIFDSQGESSLTALVAELRQGTDADFSRIPNLVWTRNGKTFRRTPRVLEHNDMDANVIDWSLFDPGYLSPTVYMRTARSCPYACAFCVYPIMAGDHEVNEVEAVIAQLRSLRERGVENIVFVDDTFNVPLPRFKKILRRMIEEQLGLRWMSFIRCSNVDDEAFALMRESGCAFSFLGIESGDADVLRNMDKFADLARYEQGIRSLEANGILTHASLIVGYPGETPRTVQNTIDFMARARPSFYASQVFFHDLRSPLEQRAKEFGLEGSGYTWSHATMDWRQAVGYTRDMIEQIRTSELTSSYSLGCWGMFYLMSQGLTTDQIRAFLRATREMVIEGLDEREATGYPELLERFKSSPDALPRGSESQSYTGSGASRRPPRTSYTRPPE
jgi:p-methyltransferase